MAEVPDGHIRESPIDGGAVVFVCVRTHFETGVATPVLRLSGLRACIFERMLEESRVRRGS